MPSAPGRRHLALSVSHAALLLSVLPHWQALLEALAKGETLAPAPAPTKIDPNSGAVRIPQKWDAKIRSALQVGRRVWSRGVQRAVARGEDRCLCLVLDRLPMVMVQSPELQFCPFAAFLTLSCFLLCRRWSRATKWSTKQSRRRQRRREQRSALEHTSCGSSRPEHACISC